MKPTNPHKAAKPLVKLMESSLPIGFESIEVSAAEPA